jgi:hypothetical protein
MRTPGRKAGKQPRSLMSTLGKLVPERIAPAVRSYSGASGDRQESLPLPRVLIRVLSPPCFARDSAGSRLILSRAWVVSHPVARSLTSRLISQPLPGDAPMRGIFGPDNWALHCPDARDSGEVVSDHQCEKFKQGVSNQRLLQVRVRTGEQAECNSTALP